MSIELRNVKNEGEGEMRAKRSIFFSIVFVLSFVGAASAVSVPSYMPVSDSYSNYATGSAEVYNNGGSYGLNYGKAKIEWSYWFDSTSNYWYYAYKVYNNEAGTSNDRTDDYHFGHVYDSGTYTPINSFDIVLPVQILGEATTTTDLFVVSSGAGSSAGGGAWNPLIPQLWTGSEWVMTGVDWSATRGGATGMPIDPTQWDYQKISGNNYAWVQTDAGDTSRGDSGSYQYFEIASTLAPGLVTAHISNGLVSSNVMIGDVYGPGVVPEPATCFLLGLGFLGLTSYRRRMKSN